MARARPHQWLAAAVVAGLVGCQSPMPSRPASFQTAKNGELVHAASGFSFPVAVGDFKRDLTAHYDASGTDVSAGYQHCCMAISATVYVYPTHRRALASEFALRQEEVSKSHEGAAPVAVGSVKVTPGQIAVLSSSYAYSGSVAGGVRSLQSELLIGQSGDWFIEYRFTYPDDRAMNAPLEIYKFEQAFLWPR